MIRAVRGLTLPPARRARKRAARGLTALRLAPVRLGSPVGVVFGFHGVVERVEDRDIQLNHVDLDAFGRALDVILGRFEIVPLADLAAALDGGRGRRPVAALSFDDGYGSTLEIVQPLLARRGVPYAIFVCPGLIDAGARLPTFVAQAAIRFVEAHEVSLPGAGRLQLGSDAARRAAQWLVVDLVKRLPQPAVGELVGACRALLGEDQWADVARRFASERLLSWPEVRTLAAAGVAVGSHTRDHASLHEAQSAEELRSQLAGSRQRLEDELGAPCSAFCYPYGRYAHLSAAGVRAVAAAGYRVGLTLETGTVRTGMSALVLPRIYVGPKFDPARLGGLLAPLRDRIFVDETRRRGLA